MQVYHVVPPNFIGTVLYPLNALQTPLPDIYATQVRKYRGREDLLQHQIPYLDCHWNDVLHFSPVSPQQIHDAVTAAGFEWHMRDWFAVDPVAMGFSSENTVIYTHPMKPGSSQRVKEEDFIPFTMEALEMLVSIPQATYEYFNHAKAYDERPFLFNFVPHVMYYGAIDTEQDGVQVIRV